MLVVQEIRLTEAPTSLHRDSKKAPTTDFAFTSCLFKRLCRLPTVVVDTICLLRRHFLRYV